jgi:hypothetical protein
MVTTTFESMNFDFLTESLEEERSYDYPASQVESLNQLLTSLAARHSQRHLYFPRPGPIGNWGVPSTTVKHCFCNASCADTWLAQLQRLVGATLPDDFKAFYTIWHEGILMTRNPVRILCIEEVISEMHQIRRYSRVSSETPYHFLRFGEINSQRHFGLRLRSDSETWIVDLNCWNEVNDSELLSSELEHSLTDKSFTQWLRRMILTDGAPLDPGWPDEDDLFVKRVV